MRYLKFSINNNSFILCLLLFVFASHMFRHVDEIASMVVFTTINGQYYTCILYIFEMVNFYVYYLYIGILIRLCLRWLGNLSEHIGVTDGVRQGRILSPYRQKKTDHQELS